jgi:hypothetical protein
MNGMSQLGKAGNVGGEKKKDEKPGKGAAKGSPITAVLAYISFRFIVS